MISMETAAGYNIGTLKRMHPHSPEPIIFGTNVLCLETRRGPRAKIGTVEVFIERKHNDGTLYARRFGHVSRPSYGWTSAWIFLGDAMELQIKISSRSHEWAIDQIMHYAKQASDQQGENT